MTHELYKRHRPRKLADVLGQHAVVKAIEGKLAKGEFPHATIFAGPSGTGKTTLARIMKKELRCEAKGDFQEINAAGDGGIVTIRNIRDRVKLWPIGGKGFSRIWLLDESQNLTVEAQSMLLKILEDGPVHAYFILATTNPEKLLKTIRTRCTEYKLQPLKPDVMKGLLCKVADAEKAKLPASVAERIIDVAEGSPRKALVLLEHALAFPTEAEQLDAVAKSEGRHQAIELARILIKPGCRWPDVAKILKDLEGEDLERLRHLILSYAKSVLLGGGPLAERAAGLIVTFESNLFDGKMAGFIVRCWEMSRKK